MHEKPDITVIDPSPVRALAAKDQADAAWPRVETDLARLPATIPPQVIPALTAVIWSYYTFNAVASDLVIQWEGERFAFVPVPDDFEDRDIARFMWAVGRQHNARNVYFGYESTADNLVVLFMTEDVFHKLTARITTAGLSDWTIETVQAEKRNRE